MALPSLSRVLRSLPVAAAVVATAACGFANGRQLRRVWTATVWGPSLSWNDRPPCW